MTPTPTCDPIASTPARRATPAAIRATDHSFDDQRDGFPDDVITFHGIMSCGTPPLADLEIAAVEYLDLDGDGDPYPDTGETGRIVLTIRNQGVTLSDAEVILYSDDPNVACITEPAVVVGSLPAGGLVAVGSLDPIEPGFTFTASDLLESDPLSMTPAWLELCVRVVANEALGMIAPACVTIAADVDGPGFGAHEFTLGEDGIADTPDDGIMSESFDIDRDGDGNFTVNDTFLQAVGPGIYRGTCSNAPTTSCATAADCPPGPPAPVCYSGAYIRGSATGTAPDTMAAVACGGYDVPPANPYCILDPDFPMDWHLHCPSGATNCPNLESGICVGGCSFDTPSDQLGAKALSLPNSLHMGAHFNSTDSQSGDTTHLRSVQAYRSAPMNLTVLPRAGDLELSFFHIARLMDNHGVSIGWSQCADCAQVQIQTDQNPDPAIDEWGFWDRIVPFQNVYDKKPSAWSYTSSYYCLFTPADTGTAPPNPRGVHETLCYDSATRGTLVGSTWASCGSTAGILPESTGDCAGPGVIDPSGAGIWVESKFDLSQFFGQRVRLRWIAESWLFSSTVSSYYELGSGWDTTTADDGWWLDDITIAGVITTQLTPLPDTKPRTGSCPVDACDETMADGGASLVLHGKDLDGNILDGITRVATAGQPVRVSAAASTFPGGCAGGVWEFEFLRNGSPVQEFSAKLFYLDAPEASAQYTVMARCSADPACMSAVGATLDLAVYSGEGGDAFFGLRTSPPDPSQGVQYDPATQTTTLNWWSPGDDAVDLYRGGIASGSARGTLSPPFYDLDTAPDPAACLFPDVAGTPATIGSNGTSGALDQVQDPDPPLGLVTYYLLSRNAPGGGSVNGLGCAAPGVCGDALSTVCAVDADCPSEACLTHTGVALPGGPLTGPLGCPPPGDPTRIVRKVDATDICP
jgi:hypothetical protein